MAGTHTRVDAPNLSSPFTLIGDTKPGIFIFYSCVYMVAFPKMLQDPQKKAPAGLRGPPTGRNDAEPPGLCRGEELLGALGP